MCDACRYNSRTIQNWWVGIKHRIPGFCNASSCFARSKLNCLTTILGSNLEVLFGAWNDGKHRSISDTNAFASMWCLLCFRHVAIVYHTLPMCSPHFFLYIYGRGNQTAGGATSSLFSPEFCVYQHITVGGVLDSLLTSNFSRWARGKN